MMHLSSKEEELSTMVDPQVHAITQRRLSYLDERKCQMVRGVVGAIQSLSRSSYSKLLPETQDHASYFSFFDVVEKLGYVIGIASFGAVETLTGDMRQSALVLLVYFVVAFFLLYLIPKHKSIQALKQ